MLKKVLKIQETLDKRTSVLESKHSICIDLISKRWSIQWVDYIVSYKNYEKVLMFTFELESFDIEIEFEITKNIIWNNISTHTIYFEREYLNEKETNELKDKIEKLYHAMNKK